MGLVNIRNGTVLLAEPDADRKVDLERVLRDARFTRVVSVSSAADAVKLLQQGKVDVFVVDMTLKDIPALDLIKAVRSGQKKLGVVVLADETSADLQTNAKSAGVQHIVPATNGGKKLISAVDALMMAKMGIASSSIAVSED